MLHCKTMALLSAAWLLPDQRPDAVEYVDDTESELRCHVQSIEDLDRCEAVFPVVRDAWATQVDGWGWYPPVPDDGVGGTDGFDIYIHTDAEGGAYVVGPYIDVDRTDDRMASSSYMVIDPSISDEELPLYLAHEFNHALQFATDFTEPTYVAWEASATWAEEATYPELSDLRYGVPSFQEVPWVGLLGDSDLLWNRFQIWSYFEYGAVMWLHHVEATYGATPLDLWMSMTNPTWDNEPDFLDAIDAATGGWEQAVLQFALERPFVGRGDEAPEWSRAAYDGDWARMRPEDELSALDEMSAPTHATYDLGTAYFLVNVGEVPVEFHYDGASAVRWAVVLPAQGHIVEDGEAIILEESQIVGVVNLGPEGFDGDDTIRPRDLEVWLTEAELPADTGDTGDAWVDTGETPGGGKGCACSARAQAPSPAWALALLGLLALRRRER
ncbi:MAG: hypothetical protein H6741_09985 [Alphaproteobacteria bacterium]|nr:hypothetical protein [Alphaproteobacteria bacterium]MCB9758214.1 hypothetical protein [Alphaproteobacteria bacterium]MCB9793042.1 hypothetical protein [Alphaproteobacteria bacterium]